MKNLYNYRLLIVTLALMLFPKAVSAQRLQASLSHYSTDNGLASNAIGYITQDDFGYVWIATWNGLSRFDGYHFYNYVTGAGSRIPHLHNRILDLTVDNQQNIWMRMYDNRVFVLRRSLDRIVNPFEGISGSEEFRSFYPIVTTSSGNVLVNVDGVGLYKMKPEADGFSSEVVTTGGFNVVSMAEGYQDDIWLGTDMGVHRMDISNLTIERKGLFLDEHITSLYSNGYNIYVGTQSGKILSFFSYGQEPVELRRGGLPINVLFVDSRGLVWFTDTRQGASRLNPATGDEKYFEQRVNAPDMDGGGGYFREAKGIVWVRMNHGGYGYYNPQTDEVEYFHNDPSNSWNLSNTVNASLELKEGVIMESTSRRGLEKLEIMEKTIGRYQLIETSELTVANEIRAVCYDRERQQLLIGNKAGQLFVFRSDSSRIVCGADSEGKPFGRIYGLSKDSKGNYWLASKDNGLYRLTPVGNSFSTVHYSHDSNNEGSLSSNGAYLSVEDKQGNIWVATYGGGVNLITKTKKGQTVVLHGKNGLKTYPYNSHQKVRTIALDREGSVWAGTTDGILIMSYQDGKASIEKLMPSEEDSEHMLMSNDIVCMGLDPQGSMWVGTNGGGLAHTIGKDSKGRWLFEHFGASDGLPGEEIRSLTFDNRGNVWFATDHVLCSYDTNKRIFTTFSSLEGVDETLCSEGAALALPDGDIIFGTLDGYYKVVRDRLTTSAGNILKLRITDFFLNGELQSPRLNDTYDYYVPDSRRVELPSHDASFTFRFASLNYQLQHRVHYQYMLEGYDPAWINADKTRQASYSGLPAGSYTFKVKAFLLESPEKYDLRQIEVVVPSSFLLSSNAIWLYMILLSAGLILIMHRRQQQLAKAANLRELKEGGRPYQYENQEEVVFMQQQHEYLELHIMESDLTPSSLIEVSGMEADDYARLLYQITRMTPRAFIADYRLKKALSLLENTNEPIADIVYKCGYPDVSAFNRVVHAKLGTTPSKYRDAQYKKY